MKVAVIISDDERWDEIERIFTSAGCVMNKDFESFSEVLDENENIIDITQYETIMVHKTDADIDDTGKFEKALNDFQGNVILFSGGIIYPEIRDRFISLNYSAYIENLESYLKNYTTENGLNLYYFLGGEAYFFTSLRNELLDSLIGKIPEFNERTGVTPGKEIVSRISSVSELSKISELVDVFLQNPTMDKFITVRNLFNSIISDKILSIDYKIKL